MEKKIIFSNEKKERLDKFLAKEFFLYSRGEIIRNIKKGNIFLNGCVCKPSVMLEKGDEITWFGFKDNPEKLEPNNNIFIDMLFEDENIAVINKKAGIQVHPDYANKTETLVNAVFAKYPEIEHVHDGGKLSFLRPGVVHRLDKETSGVLVLAKNMETFKELKKLFSQRKVQKKYLAIVYGNPPQQGVIETLIGKSADYSRQVVPKKIKEGAREAITEFRVLKKWKQYALTEAMPHTGRTHQIRVHMNHIGFPVVGDKKYPKNGVNKELYLMFPSRQMLHAQKLEFELFGNKYVFESMIPDDFKKCVQDIDELEKS